MQMFFLIFFGFLWGFFCAAVLLVAGFFIYKFMIQKDDTLGIWEDTEDTELRTNDTDDHTDHTQGDTDDTKEAEKHTESDTDHTENDTDDTAKDTEEIDLDGLTRKEQILKLLELEDTQTAEEIAQTVDSSRTYISRILNNLEEEGMVEETDRKDKEIIYELAE